MFWGSERSAGSALCRKRAHAGRRALLVSGRSSARENETYDEVFSVLRSEPESFCEYDGMTVCTYGGIEKRYDVAISGNCDRVVGLGGATYMDTAKAVSSCALYRNDTDCCPKHELPKGNAEKLRLFLIPAYPSIGAEVNGVSDTMGYAGGISGVCADAALPYAPFTYSLGREVITYSLMVVIPQAGYRFFIDGNPVSCGFTAASLRVILTRSTLSCEGSRSRSSWGSCGLGIPTSLEAYGEKPSDEEVRGAVANSPTTNTRAWCGTTVRRTFPPWCSGGTDVAPLKGACCLAASRGRPAQVTAACASAALAPCMLGGCASHASAGDEGAISVPS